MRSSRRLWRAKYRLATADAIHLATAAEGGADAFLTNNRKHFDQEVIEEIDVLYPDDLSWNAWPEKAARANLTTLALHDGWFVGGTPTLYVPPLRKFPFVVIAYDRAGHEVARKKLDSPSLLMLQHGWKEFARKYHAWQKRKR